MSSGVTGGEVRVLPGQTTPAKSAMSDATITPHYTDPLVTLYLGDSLEVMRDLADESVDSVVTDPPYGLSSVPDITEVLTHWLAGDDYKHRGGGFMGRSWDSFVPGPVYWRECFRVLKPGGHLLCFASTRTVDLMGIAVRLAGFEPRDLLMHVFASGFPKSLDVSKALDKVAGAERERVMVPTKPGNHPDQAGPIALGATGMTDTSKPVSDLARKWEGWGTALKPAHEPIVMARKPLVGTVAANVTRYGTGALNIDGTRIPGGGDAGWYDSTGSGPKFTGTTYNNGQVYEGKQVEPKPDSAGRWPSNVLLSSPELFDEPNPYVVGSGATSEAKPERTGLRGGTAWHGQKGIGSPEQEGTWPADPGGGYSRFFIIPKADRAERERGLADVKPSESMYRGLPDPRMDREQVRTPRANVHPTVKPIDLMRHLVRLVTPNGGTVLDPFLGSGTTALAASEEGFRCIGIEREAEYLEIAKGRLMATPMGLGLDVPAPEPPKRKTHPDLSKHQPKRRAPSENYTGGWAGTDEEPAA